MSGMERDIEPQDVLDAAAAMLRRIEDSPASVSQEEKQEVIEWLAAVEEYATSKRLQHDARQKRQKLKDST